MTNVTHMVDYIEIIHWIKLGKNVEKKKKMSKETK